MSNTATLKEQIEAELRATFQPLLLEAHQEGRQEILRRVLALPEALESSMREQGFYSVADEVRKLLDAEIERLALPASARGKEA